MPDNPSGLVWLYFLISVNNVSLYIFKSNLKITEISSFAMYRVLVYREAHLEAVVSFWFGFFWLLKLFVVLCFGCVLLQWDVVGSTLQQVVSSTSSEREIFSDAFLVVSGDLIINLWIPRQKFIKRWPAFVISLNASIFLFFKKKMHGMMHF